MAVNHRRTSAYKFQHNDGDTSMIIKGWGRDYVRIFKEYADVRRQIYFHLRQDDV